MKKSRTVRPTAGVESPTTRRLPLVELLIDTEAELFDLAVRSGLQVLDAMLEEDRTAICGPRYAHQADRTASRAGPVASTVVLGGRKVSIRRPRVRSGRQEVPLPTFQTMAQTDPLRRRTVEQLLVGVSTRGYARSLEPLPADIPSRSVSKSAVSRRFVAKTASQLAAWQATPLDELDLVGLLLDGVHIGEHCVVVALGIGVDGTKHALGLWEGSTENATVCQSLLANLQSRGLRTDRSILVMLDGSKALRAAAEPPPNSNSGRDIPNTPDSAHSRPKKLLRCCWSNSQSQPSRLTSLAPDRNPILVQVRGRVKLGGGSLVLGLWLGHAGHCVLGEASNEGGTAPRRSHESAGPRTKDRSLFPHDRQSCELPLPHPHVILAAFRPPVR